ncbi:MAG: hypothetical protein ACOYYS_17765 [Chloroflexota bacterium]
MSMQKQLRVSSRRIRFLRGEQALETAEWAVVGAALIMIVYAVYRALGAQIANVIGQIMASLG